MCKKNIYFLIPLMSTERVPLNLELVTSPASATHVLSGEIEITMVPIPYCEAAVYFSSLCLFPHLPGDGVILTEQRHCPLQRPATNKDPVITPIPMKSLWPVISERVLPAQRPAYSKCLINPSRWCSVVITASSFSKALTSIFHTLSQHVQLNSVFFVKPTTAVSSLWEEGLF